MHVCFVPVLHRPIMADFGGSRTMLHPSFSFTGTPLFMAPEVLQREAYHLKVDIFSLGIMLWQLATGLEPHAGVDNYSDLKCRVLQGARPALDVPQLEAAPRGLRELLAQCWHEDPKLRPSAAGVLDSLKDLAQHFTHRNASLRDSYPLVLTRHVRD
jgi:serine/threonine protein kinase